MQFWLGKEIITPTIPVLQCGFASRIKKSEGVHDDTYVSVVLIKEKTMVIFITLDVVYGDRSFSDGIKQAIYEKYNISSDKIIINYSHTHSSVAITGDNMEKRNHRPYSMASDTFFFHGEKESIDFSVDEAYYMRIKNSILCLISKGLSNLIEGEMSINKSESTFGISRRLPVDGKIAFRPYDNDEAMDKDLFIIKLVDNKNVLKGIIYNYACHPSAIGSGNHLISSDFVGEVRVQLEKVYPSAEVVFLQGCGADIKPRCCSDDEYFYSCDFDQLHKGSLKLVTKISAALQSTKWKKIIMSLCTKETQFYLQTNVKDKSFFEQIYNNKDEAPYRRESALAVIENMDKGVIFSKLLFYINIIRFDETTCIIALENEIASDMGKMIKKLSNENIIVLGYSNSISGYIPTKEVLLHGGYEGENFMMVRLAGQFQPDIDDIIINESYKLIKNSK